jgi:hypothetical protein
MSNTSIVDVLEVADFNRIQPLLKPKRFVQALEKSNDRRKMIETVAAFVEADVVQRLNMVQAGEVYYRLTQQPIEKLHEFLTEYAAQEGVAGPKPLDHAGGKGRPISVGTRIIADVVYGKHPEFLRKSGKSSTLAAKSVDACIRKYKKVAGIIKAPKRQPWPQKVPKSGRQMIVDLFEVADQKHLVVLQELIRMAWGAGAVSQLKRLFGQQIEEAA